MQKQISKTSTHPPTTEYINPYQIFVGAFIPNCIMQSTQLTPSEKLVYARLNQFAGKNGKCYPSQTLLAEEVGLKVDTVQKILKSLENKKFIERVQPTGRDRLLHKNNNYRFIDNQILKEGRNIYHPDSHTGPESKERKDSDTDPDSHTGRGPDSHTGRGPDSHTGANKDISSKDISSKTLSHIENSKSTPSKRTKYPSVPKNEVFAPLADQLKSMIADNRRTTIKSSDVKNWTNDIRLLCQVDKINPARIKRALDWYAHHIGQKYIPEIFSGSALRRKFIQLEAAIDRSNQPAPQNEKNNQNNSESLRAYAAKFKTGGIVQMANDRRPPSNKGEK